MHHALTPRAAPSPHTAQQPGMGASARGRGLGLLAALGAGLAVLAGCAATGPSEGPPRPETLVAVTAGGELIRFNAGQPSRITTRVVLQGLGPGDALVGVDFRVARGVLYGLGRSGQLYTVNATTGSAQAVGAAPATALQGTRFGFDFNPTGDRIRVMSDAGQNLRLHPDTGALATSDPAAAYAEADPAAGRTPQVTGVGYTYNKRDEKLTTNFAIDRALGTLVTMGTAEGVQPAVSPNTGRLFTVGTLGLGAPLEAVSFDIADLDNTALAAVRASAQDRTQLVLVDLKTGRATPLGTVGRGEPLVGLAIEP
jgi:hypothetical protein